MVQNKFTLISAVLPLLQVYAMIIVRGDTRGVAAEIHEFETFLM